MGYGNHDWSYHSPDFCGCSIQQSLVTGRAGSSCKYLVCGGYGLSHHMWGSNRIFLILSHHLYIDCSELYLGYLGSGYLCELSNVSVQVQNSNDSFIQNKED